MPFHKVIGIDLGTTYSAVSIWDGKDVRVIESAFGLNTVPSVVGLDSDGDVIVGTPAQNNLVSDPTNTVIEVKREMGTYEVEPAGPIDPGVPKRIRFRGRQYLPQEISAFILKELKRQAENIVGEPIHDAVITVPAYFKDPQRGATEDAAQMAQMNVRMLLNEPTAAAVCFGADKIDDEQTHTYAVYDLGGGTFDVSIVQLKDSLIPGEVTKDNFVNGAQAKEINVLIFQGEDPVAFANDLIGTLPIVLPEAKELGYYRFAVTFSLDVHGLLKVAVKCLNDDQIWQTELQCNVRATKEQIEESSKHLSEVMAGGSNGATPTETRLPTPPGSLPKPPGRASAAEPQPVPPPPAQVPDEFKSTARRVYKLIPSIEPPGRDRLTAKYQAFVAAVHNDSSDVEELGDELYDLYRELRE